MKTLSDHKLYLRQVERLHKKYLQRGKLYGTLQDGVPFSRISILRKSFAKALAKQVAKGEYQFKPATKRRIRKSPTSKKYRTIYQLELTDLVVHGALGDLLATWSNPLLPSSVYSYRQGKGWWDAISALTNFIREYHSLEPSPSKRGLYVCRGDVKEYTESIPVASSSPLWAQLRDLVQSQFEEKEEASKTFEFIQSALRPPINYSRTALHSELLGIPTGSPASTTIANLYLSKLDQRLSNVPGAFYARYGDDFLFAHPDPEIVINAEREMNQIVDGLQLRLNQEKFERFYFNGAGKASPAYPLYRGTQQLTFVGCMVNFKAEVSLSTESTRKLRLLIRRRIRRMAPLLLGLPLAERGKLLCQMINRILEPGTVMSHPFAEFLAKSVTSRGELKDLDNSLALLIAEALSGIRGAKAFREVPYSTIRSTYGLKSLVHTRNQGKSRP